jgi:anti-sigma factor (TIGR02949 family)
MADCKKTLQELEQFLDHELSADAHHAVQRHIDGCLDCLSTFDFHAELKTVIAAKARTIVLPDSLLAKIEACFGVDDDESVVDLPLSDV